MTTPSSTRLARDIRGHIPPREQVDGYLTLEGTDAAIWDAAVPYLRVRNNDRHTLYAYGIARERYRLALREAPGPALRQPGLPGARQGPA